jgi:hypothetical protein
MWGTQNSTARLENVVCMKMLPPLHGHRIPDYRDAVRARELNFLGKGCLVAVPIPVPRAVLNPPMLLAI